MTKSIVFDMDGVLFDSERIYYRAWHRAGKKLGLPETDDCVTHCVGRNGSDIRDYLLESYGPQFPVNDFIEDIKAEFYEIVKSEGLPQKTGVRELLEWLTENHWKVGLATSSTGKTAERNLEMSCLSQYFKTIVTGDMIRHGKPDPDIYLLACSNLGVTPDGCYAVEDSSNGILSAYAAGLNVIFVPDMIKPPPEVERLIFRTFPSLVEAKAYLAGLAD